MPNLPSVTSPLPRDLQMFVQRVREAIDGGGLDGLVTARQMVVAGIAGITNGTVTSAATSVIGAPTPPTGLAGSGALASVVLTWAAPTYSGHAYTEIWAATQTAAQVAAGEAPVITQAVLIGMTAGNSFSHGIGSGATRYYWVKNVNRNGEASAFNATNGIAVTTSDDPEYLMEVLSEAFGGTSAAPFFQVDTSTDINGVAVPAGTYMKAAFIHNASITNAMIGDAAVDSAKIANATIVAGDIANAAITGAKIGTATITGANIADATITNANIALATITNANIGDAVIDVAKIDTGTITDLSSLAVDAGTITAGVLKSSDDNFVIDLDNKTITIST